MKSGILNKLCVNLIVALMMTLTHTGVLGQTKKTPVSFKVTNFDKDGNQIIRYSKVGDAIDAHDGEIALFGDTYYLYGTSYDCGFEWQNKNAAFCGFKVYTSKDMLTWTDKGQLFNANTKIWQTRCNGSTYGCFRPHVVYNKNTQQYVLWINVYDNVSGYRVFTSRTPSGPFEEVAEPKLKVNENAPAAGLNNGDHDLFVDDDGTAYIALTDWREHGRIMIEKLSDNYLTGTGEVSEPVTEKSTEAPGMFKRNGIYYVVYSDPNCGYCGGTGASYKTASSPLGPWSASKKISDNSCGGQPSFVSTIKLLSGTVYLFGSDLWNNAARNEALGNYFWAPLSFNPDGSIIPIECVHDFNITGKAIVKTPAKFAANSSFKGELEIKAGTAIAQNFVAVNSGILKRIEIPLFLKGAPKGGLKTSIYATNGNSITGEALTTKTLTGNTLGWSVKNQVFEPRIKVIKGTTYCIVLSSETSVGSYGYTYNVQNDNKAKPSFGKLENSTIIPESGKKLNFKLSTVAAK
ncbi:family 43 glycosylhydrolase [Mucilaginibacter corticis]|uniref:Family 43 glycosylhydrolase n=1 Tax=Mucilaginibacter corticis TaxID=2597670 RepID=A0A556MX05_9SPHI|nr:family 43 glycosylhydrolase [Mucilaginibacter corticis]TSJ44451.1 family 43 glycosylhydrolase [Mucilaginibacter corticis]